MTVKKLSFPKFFRRLGRILLLLFSIGIYYSIVSAASSSTNYKIPLDILGESGGQSTSGTYKVFTNVGESVVGIGQSANYHVYEGFVQFEEPTIIFSISNSAVALSPSPLTTGTVSTGNTVLTVSTNIAGYTATASDNTSPGTGFGFAGSGGYIADVASPNSFVGLPYAGTEGFGIIATGTDADSGYAGGTQMTSMNNTTPARLGSHYGPITNSALTIQYRVTISNTSPAGSYQNNITYSVTGTF